MGSGGGGGCSSTVDPLGIASPMRRRSGWTGLVRRGRGRRLFAGASQGAGRHTPSSRRAGWFSIMTAQILAAAAASLSGPATSRNCIPAPVLLSLIMMIGCNAANGAFDRDLSRPRHSARKPPTEFAPPTSTANSVCLHLDFGRHRRRGVRFRRVGLAGGRSRGDHRRGWRRRWGGRGSGGRFRRGQFPGRGIRRSHHRFRGRRRRSRCCRRRACSECPVRRTPARWGPVAAGSRPQQAFPQVFPPSAVTVVATAAGAGRRIWRRRRRRCRHSRRDGSGRRGGGQAAPRQRPPSAAQSSR